MAWTRRGDLAICDGSSWKCRRISARRGKAAKGSIVLAHGLFLYGFYMGPLGRRLAADGYEVHICDYPTRRCGILEHGTAFAELLRFLAAELEEGAKLHIATHSLGGLLARVALQRIESEGGACASRIGRTVMLAPPNRGSDMARRVSRLFPSWSGRFAKPLPELSSAPDSIVHSLPIPKSFEIGIIAGTCDIEVAAPFTELPTASAWKALRSDHTFMPFYPHVYRELTHFLAEGAFCEEDETLAQERSLK
jgi:triacylglycerol esterase/lipase EstA (alpha/beta hydrolase family)